MQNLAGIFVNQTFVLNIGFPLEKVLVPKHEGEFLKGLRIWMKLKFATKRAFN